MNELLLTVEERFTIWQALAARSCHDTGKFEQEICRAQVEKLKRLGLVIVAENQAKPALHAPGLEKTNEQYQRGFQDGYDMGQDSMVSAGFRRIEEIA